MKATNEQAEIYKFIVRGQGCAIIEALAGTGKTTTITTGANLIDSQLKSIFLAFNKDIVNELVVKQKAGKFSHEIEVRTFNSFGNKCLTKSGIYKFGDLDKKYLPNFIQEVYQEWSAELEDADEETIRKYWKKNSELLYELRDHITMCKANMALDRPSILKIAKKYAFAPSEWRIEFIHHFLHTVYLSSKLPANYDYKDQIFLPAMGIVGVEKYDFIFVDECQDLNKAQHQLLLKMMHENTRVVAVGDGSQAIYGFNGADTESFQNLQNILPNCSTFSLTTCFRCKEGIIDFVNQSGVNTSITHFEGNKGGKVRYGSWKEIGEGDIVLCRINAPLLDLFIDLQRTGLKVGMRSDRQTISIILKRLQYHGKNTIQYVLIKEIQALEEYGKYLSRTNSDYPNVENHPKYIHRKEYYDIMCTIAESHNCKTGYQLRTAVQKVFNDPSNKVLLMSIHRSKGLEAERVFILGDDLTPHKRAKEPWQLVQEDNLVYVSYTRAKSELIFIDDFDKFVSNNQLKIAYESQRYENTLIFAELTND